MQRLSTTTSNHFSNMTFVPRGIYNKSVSHRFYHSLHIRLPRFFLCVPCRVDICIYVYIGNSQICNLFASYTIPWHTNRFDDHFIVISLFYRWEIFSFVKIAYEQKSSVILNGDAIRNSNSVRYPLIDPNGFWFILDAYCIL